MCLHRNRSEGHRADDDLLVLFPDEGAGAAGFLGVQLQLHILHNGYLLGRRLEHIENQSGLFDFNSFPPNPAPSFCYVNVPAMIHDSVVSVFALSLCLVLVHAGNALQHHEYQSGTLAESDVFVYKSADNFSANSFSII
jgi:hypothetical protein